MGRRRESGQSPVPLYKKVLKIFQADGSSADLQQSPRHVADHVMQKSVSLDRQKQAMSLFLQFAAEYASDRAGGGRACFRKTGEIVLSLKQTRRLGHLRQIDGKRVMKIFAYQMGRQDRAQIDLVAVDF